MEATTRKIIRDYGGTVLGAVTVALLIRIYVIEAYRIPTPAMKPTLEPGDTVFVAKAPIGTQLLSAGTLPSRGDVVLFRPEDGTGRDYIKRVIALPNETVELHNGKLRINGHGIDVQMLPNSNCGSEALPGEKPRAVCFEPPVSEDYGPEKVPEGSIFVLGDFRSASQTDSLTKGKSWGIIPRAWIRGRALWVWLSIDPPAPSEAGGLSGRFPKFRFERMFRRIE